MDIKLPRMPSRTSIDISFTADGDLSQALDLYAEAYKNAYGRSESIEDLIPFMLTDFMKHDREFMKELRARRKAARNGARGTLQARTSGNA